MPSLNVTNVRQVIARFEKEVIAQERKVHNLKLQLDALRALIRFEREPNLAQLDLAVDPEPSAE